MALLTTGQVAAELRTSKPTVRDLLQRRVIPGRKETRGRRFRWLVDSDDLARYVEDYGRLEHRRRQGASKLSQVETQLAALRQAVERQLAGPDRDAMRRERDDLRAEVTSLRDALIRIQTAVDLMIQADKERAETVGHLLAAVSAAERAEAQRRDALAEYAEALAAFSRPGHLGQMH